MADEIYGSYSDRQGKDEEHEQLLDKRSVDEDYESLPVMSSWTKMNLGSFEKKSENDGRRIPDEDYDEEPAVEDSYAKRSVMEERLVAGELGEHRAEAEKMEKYSKNSASPKKSYKEGALVAGEPGEHRDGRVF